MGWFWDYLQWVRGRALGLNFSGVIGFWQLTNSSAAVSTQSTFSLFFDEYGLITRPPAVEALRKALEFPANQTINIRQRIETALRAAQGVKQEKTAAAKEEVKKGKKAAFIIKTANFLEKFLEMSDSKRRRRDADSVLNDLTRRAISHERAAQAMHEITVRQKGGWLAKKFFKD